MRIESLDNFCSRRSPVLSRTGVVATSQPAASAAGAEVLSRGGNAADAAVAAAAALQVTQPCSTGLGGDAFCLYYDAAHRTVRAINGSGPAPRSLNLDVCREAARTAGTGNRIPPYHAYTVTVPGAAAAWELTLSTFGRLSLGDVLAPAIRLAENGFPVAPLTAKWWATGVEKQLSQHTHGHELMIDGRAPRAGESIALAPLARTLRAIAEGGADAFYRGEIAVRIEEAVREAGGVLGRDDLASFAAEEVSPISVEYRGFRVWECPPNGQGLAALIALNVLSRVADWPAGDPGERYHVAIEAMRVAFADAGAYIADPAFARVPVEALLGLSYASERARSISPDRRAESVGPGKMPAAGDDTVYLAVVDRDGNACSFINSNFAGFGTGIVPRGCGFSLQNRGHGFVLDTDHPNVVAPGKRPYHTIIPGMITRADGSLFGPFGVMGGMMQPQGHVQVVTSMIDDDVDPQATLDRPRFQIADGEPDGEIMLEDSAGDAVARGLTERGHAVRFVHGAERAVFGLGQVIRVEQEVAWAGSDPRGDGCASAPLP